MLSLATPLTGKLNVTGSLSSKATGAVSDAIGGLLGGNAAKQIGSINIKSLNASRRDQGQRHLHLAAEARRQPGTSSLIWRRRSMLGDTSLSVAGARVNVPAQVKPLIDKTVGRTAQCRRRRGSAPIRRFERNARVQWAKACRSIPLQGAGATASLPALWLEMRADPRDRGAAARRCVRR